VLPLHHEATSEKIKTDLPCCKSSAVALARELALATGLWPVNRDVKRGVLERLTEPWLQKTCKVEQSANLSGCDLRLEQDLSAFSSRFDFQRLSALCDQRARVFHHFIDHFIVMIWIVMKKHKLAHV
jgi:hypothetical protein